MDERIVGLDIGDARIGVAVCDETRTIASPLTVINRVGYSRDIAAIAKICADSETHVIVSGLPKNMDGSEGFQAESVRKFCAQLQNAGYTVYFQDERLTTVTAENALLEDNMSRGKRKHKVDKVAASVILQTYIDILKEVENGVLRSNDIVQFYDSENHTANYQMMGNVEYNGENYVTLVALDERDMMPLDDENAFIAFGRETTDENGDYSMELIEDEELSNEIFAKFMQDMEETENDKQ